MYAKASLLFSMQGKKARDLRESYTFSDFSLQHPVRHQVVSNNKLINIYINDLANNLNLFKDLMKNFYLIEFLLK